MAMDWADVQQAKMTEEIGLKQPVEYTDEERRTIATHEAGHATVAYLVGQNRKLEVLSIIKRRDALGLLAHSDGEERFTRTRSELLGMMKIAFGGMTRRGAVLRRVGHRSVRATSCTRRAIAAQMVGSFGMAGSLVSFEAIEAGPIAQGIVGKVLGNDERRARRSRSCSSRRRPTCRRCSTRTATSSIALRDELLERDGAGRRRDHRRAARGGSPQASRRQRNVGTSRAWMICPGGS